MGKVSNIIDILSPELSLGNTFGEALGVSLGEALGAAFGEALGEAFGATLGDPFSSSPGTIFPPAWLGARNSCPCVNMFAMDILKVRAPKNKWLGFPGSCCPYE